MVLQAPEAFVCPITCQLMEDPVVDPEGHTYERAAIEDWVGQNSTSPITRNLLTAAELVSNFSLRQAIEEWKKQTGSQEYTVPDPGVGISKDVVKKLPVLASIIPGKGQREPIDVCCVIDVSGSMGTEATVQQKAGVNEKSGLGLLDVVKHAVLTISNILGDNDRMSIVTFSDVAKEVYPLKFMNQGGRKSAKKVLDGLSEGGRTNLWDGLHTGLETMRTEAEVTGDRKKTVLLLTDGQPNVEPPRGHLPMLRRYMESNEGLKCSINTFGFGYDIDQKLLSDLANEGNGTYSFIPDAGMVGTVFIHSISNSLSCLAQTATIDVELTNGAELVSVNGAKMQTTSWGATLNVGHVQHGQTKDIVLNMKLADQSTFATDVQATAKLSDGTKVPVQLSMDPAQVKPHVLRYSFVDLLKTKASVESGLRSFIRRLKGANAENPNEYTKALQEDCEGQVSQAISRADWYNKWGCRFLPSLRRAHDLQLCNNFKDPGVQLFGGEVFSAIRDEADAIFCKLPPPKARKKYTAPAPTSMRNYHCRSSGCFEPSCKVTMADGSKKRVDAVKKGDKVKTPTGSAEVQCAVVIAAKGNTSPMVQLKGGLSITPYHPVRIQGQWKFPIDVASVVERPIKEVITFVLTAGHVMYINDVECVTLGHNFNEKVVAHPFFGSQKVINDLKKKEGWTAGLVRLSHNSFVRKNGDKITNIV